MTSPRYAELHAHSAFSFLDGASHPEELAAEGATDPDAATLDVVVELPGTLTTTDGEQADGSARWSFSASGGEAVSEQLQATSSSSGAPVLVFAVVAVLAAIGAIAALVMGLTIRRR